MLKTAHTINTRAQRHKTLAALPSIEAVLQDERIAQYKKHYSHEFITFITRHQVTSVRNDLKNGKYPETTTREELTDRIVAGVEGCFTVTENGSLVSAVNATGVILHTGLGRAPLSPAAVKHIRQISSGYSTLEIDRETGQRGNRDQRFDDILRFISGAEAGTVVNNNAAAVMITLNTLAREKDVIVSRGELVEIGGSFRMPEIMAVSGANMVEVGTTNKTKLSDYKNAIHKNTGALLKVHSSNFKVLGFSETVPLAQLCELVQKKNIPVIYDLGGGILYDLRQFGLPYEPVVAEAIKEGADVVTFSGDKVLGGPQAGIIVGKKKYVSRIKKNPIARAIRCDKLILAALYGTMCSYLKGVDGFKSLPATKMLLESQKSIQRRAHKIVSQLGNIPNKNVKILLEACESEVGSGAMPLEQLPSYSVTISSIGSSPQKIAKILRRHTPPIYGYIKNNRVNLDIRTVFHNQILYVVNGIQSVIQELQ